MKNNLYKSFFVGFVLLFASCEGYLDVNESPNDPLYDQLTPDLTLSGALSQTSRIILGDSRNVERGSVGTENTNQLGNLMLNSWAGDVNSFTGANSAEYFSNVTSTFYDNIWDYGYTNIANFQKIINYKGDNYDNHKAVAKLMKCFYMQTIVDLYGDCPYSQAFKGNDNLAPVYDDDKAIYRNLLKEVDEAIVLINNGTNDTPIGPEDCVMKGNLFRWKQFANTLKLRLIVRQDKLTDADSVAYLAAQSAILGALSPSDFLQADVTINPGYNKTAVDRQNPFYARYGYTIAGTPTLNRSFFTASEYAATKLNATGDTRKGRLFTLIGGLVVGINQGANSGGTTPTAASFLGPAIVPTPTGVSPNLDSTVGSEMNGYLMTLSEVNFLISEAALKFPAAFSAYNAQTYFRAGVTASFVRLKVGATDVLSTTAATTYLSLNDTVAGYGWTGSASNLIEAIMTQKWLALMCVNAGESWIDYVRTGYPAIPNAITNTFGKPKRLLYPTSETVTNASNVPAQTAASAFASGPFWKI